MFSVIDVTGCSTEYDTTDDVTINADLLTMVTVSWSSQCETECSSRDVTQCGGYTYSSGECQLWKPNSNLLNRVIDSGPKSGIRYSSGAGCTGNFVIMSWLSW
jgi:hypothetical protein